MQSSYMLLASLCATGAVLGLFIWLRTAADGGRPVEERLRELAPPPAENPAAHRTGLAERLNRMISALGIADAIRTALLRADSAMTVPQFLLLSLGLAAALALLAFALTGNVLVELTFGAVGLLLPRLYLGYQHGRRLSAFQAQLPDVLMLMVGSLRAGYSILSAFEAVAREVPPPASLEFGRVVREISLGLSLEQALANLLQRVNSRDLELLATAINVQAAVGGNLADVLDTIAQTIRERVRIQGEIRVLSAQQRYTGYILAGLPFAAGLLLLFVNPKYILRLFTPGLIFLPILALIAMGIGFLVIRQILDMEV